MDFDGPPIIIKKIKKGGHGHHGGGWKVAYADFVTAMMALFIVLWIVGQNDPVKQAVSEYFIDPSLSPEEIAVRLSQSKLDKMGESETELILEAPEDSSATDTQMKDLAKEIRSALEELDWESEANGQIIIEVTEEGLRIELIDLADAPFFDLGSSVPKRHTQDALKAIGEKLRPNKHPLIFEGHTDAQPFKRSGYGNWELSTDRANAARRILTEAGVNKSRVKAVRGYADTRLRDKSKPSDPSNRRVSILVQHGSTKKSSGKNKVSKKKTEKDH